MNFKEALNKAHMAKCRNGALYMIVRFENNILGLRKEGFNTLNSRDVTESPWDVVELIYLNEHTIGRNVFSEFYNNTLSPDKYKVIWSESNYIVTLKEIAEKFNIPLELLKIKK